MRGPSRVRAPIIGTLPTGDLPMLTAYCYDIILEALTSRQNWLLREVAREELSDEMREKKDTQLQDTVEVMRICRENKLSLKKTKK